MPLFVFNYKNPNGHCLKKVCLLLLLHLMALPVSAQDLKTKWVDSVFQTLKVQEKIGQLLMVPVSSYSRKEELEELKRQIKLYHFGGLFITRGGPQSHVRMLNQLHDISAVPMLVAANAEWGLGQTLDSTLSFQKPLVLGALRTDSLVGDLGAEIGREMKILGIHVNFAPHADIDIHPENSSIALRYFSNDKKRVAARSLAFMKGLQQEGIMACAKHLPVEERYNGLNQDFEASNFNVNRLDTLDFYPYQQLINEGLEGMLTTHLHFSAEEKRGLVPASISELFISEILKKKIGFKGLTFTEIPHLQSVSGKLKPGETELLAFSVGNDILISPLNPKEAIRKIQKALKKNPILQNQLDASVKKILEAKYKAGLHELKKLNSDNLNMRLNSEEAQWLKHQVAEAAVTVVKNNSGLIPIQVIDSKSFVSLSVGKGADNEFTHYLGKYANVSHHAILQIADTLGLKEKLANADVIFVALFPGSGIGKEVAPLIKQLTTDKELVLCNFGNPFLLTGYESMPTIIQSYTDDDLMPKIAAQIIFGGMGADGVLPVTIPAYPIGSGEKTTEFDRFSYTPPFAAQMDSETLNQIEAIAEDAIEMGATPGCHVLIAKDGKVVFEQSFGSQKYDNKIPITNETIFDLASVTKVAATLQAIMFLQEKGLIDIDKKISVYLPELKESNKKDFIIKDILTHQAGLWPFLPFWAHTMKDSVHLPEYYSTVASPDYPFPVAENLFATKHMKDSLWQWIIKAKIREKPDRTPYDYRYSDMGFYILQHLAEKILNQPMEDFLSQNLYEPIGAYTTGYLPLQKFAMSRIAPTENDNLFRKSLLTGYVHDQGAAMHGGVAGHAGLFSTANDLAKLGQLWLQKGSYGGQEIFKPETIDLFTLKQYEHSRRGLGWDKPVLGDPSGPTSLFASAKTFGHTGFTGTCIWVDPEFNLVYVFLSNRVYPDMNNNKLLNANIRPRIQDVIYQSIFNYCRYHSETKPVETRFNTKNQNLWTK